MITESSRLTRGVSAENCHLPRHGGRKMDRSGGITAKLARLDAILA